MWTRSTRCLAGGRISMHEVIGAGESPVFLGKRCGLRCPGWRADRLTCPTPQSLLFLLETPHYLFFKNLFLFLRNLCAQGGAQIQHLSSRVTCCMDQASGVALHGLWGHVCHDQLWGGCWESKRRCAMLGPGRVCKCVAGADGGTARRSGGPLCGTPSGHRSVSVRRGHGM